MKTTQILKTSFPQGAVFTTVERYAGRFDQPEVGAQQRLESAAELSSEILWSCN